MQEFQAFQNQKPSVNEMKREHIIEESVLLNADHNSDCLQGLQTVNNDGSDDINVDIDEDYFEEEDKGSQEGNYFQEEEGNHSIQTENSIFGDIFGQQSEIAKNPKIQKISIPKLTLEKPFSQGSFSVMAAQIDSKSQHRDDPSFRTITEKQLDQLIPLFKQYQQSKEKKNENKLTIQEIANLVGIKKEHTIKLFQQFREDSFLAKRRLAIQYTKNIKKVPLTAKNQMRVQYIKQIVQNNCMLSIKQIVKVMCNIKALVDVSKPERAASIPIVKKLLKKLGYVKSTIKKVPATSNSPDHIAMRKFYCDFYQKMRSQGHEFIYFGCTDFHYLMYRNHGWGYNGRPPILNSKDPKKMVSLQCVVTKDGMKNSSLKCGILQKYDHTEFLLKFMKNWKKSPKIKYLGMNSSMMKYKDDIELVMKGFDNHLQVIYLPPESPLINPLEHIFRNIKIHIQAKKFTNNKDLYIFLNNQLKNKYEEQSLLKFFQEAEVYISQGAKKQQM